ncbi:Dephospho-CoA kinase [Nymphon striatum]|nr:Dephospho-CoA kinase [Nymphon striatum]
MIGGLYIVALTGGIGSGKTQATNMFAVLGVPIVDLDVISHQLTAANQPLVDTIKSTFGNEYVSEDGALERTKMRQLVFNSDSARSQLNNLLHPAIFEEAFKQLKKIKNSPYAIIAIPLLKEDSAYRTIIDRVLTIDCDEDTQIDRVKVRNHLSEEEIKKIIASQVPRPVRLKMADDIIKNDGNIEELSQKVENLHQKYIKTCIVNKTIS